jgi:DNA-directed RNA polymerase subunit RPC12/RpoP
MPPSPAAVLLAHIDIPPRLLGSLIVLGICLIVWFFKAVFSGPEKGLSQQRPGAPSCATCGAQARWLMPQNYWNCDRCNKPVVVGAPAPPPVVTQPVVQQQQFCGACGTPGRWIPESNAWGCDRCRHLIQAR